MLKYQSDPVTQRLDRLERENWYWKRATLLLLIVIGAAILMGQATKPNLIEGQIVRAQKIEIIDDEGQTRGILYYERTGVGDGKVVLGLYSKYGETGSELLVFEEFARFSLYTGEKYTLKERQVLNEIYKRRRAGKELSDDFKLETEMRARFGQRTAVYIGTERHEETNKIIKAELSLHGGQGGDSRVRLDGQGDSTIEIKDQKGTQAILGNTTLEYRTTGVNEKRPASSLVLINKDQKVFWKTP